MRQLVWTFLGNSHFFEEGVCLSGSDVHWFITDHVWSLCRAFVALGEMNIKLWRHTFGMSGIAVGRVVICVDQGRRNADMRTNFFFHFEHWYTVHFRQNQNMPLLCTHLPCHSTVNILGSREGGISLNGQPLCATWHRVNTPW